MINEAVELVREFQKKAKQPVSDVPTMLNDFQVKRRIKWVKQEINELDEAKDIYEQADALVDTLYYLLGAFVEMGINPDQLFKTIHKYNMKKVINKKVSKSKDGRVLKPDEWTHPDKEIRAIIDEMMLSSK